MAILISGKICQVCHQIILENEEIIGFTTFVFNENDPLFQFNDQIYHLNCFNSHPLSNLATDRYQRVKESIEHKKYVCEACHETILNPDEFIGFPYFTDDSKSDLYPYNLFSFHYSCLMNSEISDHVYSALINPSLPQQWKGKSIDWLLGILENCKKRSNIK
jgi:hypothetical protein